VGNPEHMEMRQNLDYYQTMSGVKETDFKDLEAKPHMVKKTISFSLSLFKILFIYF
jgi:leucine proline-enriched proteoglycan (leprecan)